MKPRINLNARAAFTLIELLVVIAIIAILAGMLLPALGKAKAKGETIACMNNLKQIALFMQLYTDENQEVFPGHRNGNLTTADELPSRTNWWGTAMVGYAKGQSNYFRCHALKGKRKDAGISWSWKFDSHLVGYGYNAFFLGVHPYDSHEAAGLSTTKWFKRSSIVNPSQNLVVGDAMPKPDLTWSSSLWWPSSGMTPGRGNTYEGIDDNRHGRRGNVVFNDGHAETRRSANINPPDDPIKGGVNQFRNAIYWDPLQRKGRACGPNRDPIFHWFLRSIHQLRIDPLR